MTLYQFNELDEMEQAEAVWDAVFLSDRKDNEHRILLYQIDDFYVEAYYHIEYNVLRRFRSFSSLDQLGPYLDQIDLTGKFKKKDEIFNSSNKMKLINSTFDKP